MIRPIFAVTLLAIALGITPAAMPQQIQRPELFVEMTGAQVQSVRRGMEWLEKTQNIDGLWGCEKSGAPSTAITGLSVLAFLASGSTPSAGPHAARIRRAVDRLIAFQARTGQITRYDSTGMGIFYDHSCATLALAEVYGMCHGNLEMECVHDALVSAVRFMYSVQNDDGGWGPMGRESQSDIAITCSVWMALRAAHNGGISIETARMEKVESFVLNCAEPQGGFRHAPVVQGGGGQMFYPTSAGLRILHGIGKRELKEVEKGMELLLTKMPGDDYRGRITEWDYCAAFFAVQAMMHEGDAFWRRWWPRMRDYLVRIQNQDGSWTIQYCTCCRAYATALSILVLQAPQRLLPIFQL
jgi:prenyltransferase beta subunit